jgi:hypothetical protein
MKKLIVICLIISGIATAIPASAKQQQRASSKDDQAMSKAFADNNQDDANNGAGFSLALRHVEKGKYIAPGSIKAFQIFPVNTVTGGFTYNFS